MPQLFLFPKNSAVTIPLELDSIPSHSDSGSENRRRVARKPNLGFSGKSTIECKFGI